MICTFCRASVLLSGNAWGDHHVDPSEFEKSAGGAIVPEPRAEQRASLNQSQGCIFCWKLAQNLRGNDSSTLDTWLKPIDPGDPDCPAIPVYRWTFRKAAKVDEMDDYFVLWFTPILIDEDRQDKYRSRAQLPDAIFYLLQHEGGGFTTDRLSGSTGESWDQIKEWLTDCEGHEKCQHTEEPFMPDRFLDVGLNTIPELQEGSRLRILERQHNQADRYVTLSHSWGPQAENGSYPFPQLLSGKDGTLENFIQLGVPWNAILKGSRNFAHAIIVARQLGVKYIWIDSLCIIQNDEEDWKSQSQLMHKVYRHSFCNISASDSTVPADGLFRGLRTESHDGQNSATINLRGQSWRVVPADLWDGDLLKSPLYTRGWVFQERMLSPRMLHFASHQIFWDCASKSACETFPSGIPAQLDWVASIERNWRQLLQNKKSEFDVSSDPANSSTLFWKNAVRNYTGCKLTMHEDKLKAIWGIAKLMRDVAEDDYGAGLWGWNLHEQLAWTVVDNAHAERDTLPAPSWSWASIKDGAIDIANQEPDLDRFYYVLGHRDEPIRFELTKPLYTPDDANEDNAAVPQILEFDKDKEPELKGSGLIELRGLFFMQDVLVAKDDQGNGWHLVIPGSLEMKSTKQIFLDTAEHVELYKLIILTASKEVVGAFDENGEPIYGRTEHMQGEVYSGTGMLLEGEGDVYRRAGILKFSSMSRMEWLGICRGCGQENGLSHIPDKDKFTRIYLG